MKIRVNITQYGNYLQRHFPRKKKHLNLHYGVRVTDRSFEVSNVIKKLEIQEGINGNALSDPGF